jgi:hypothetical protein
MEVILSEHNNAMPAREILVALADKFRCVTVHIIIFSIVWVEFNMLLKSGIKFVLPVFCFSESPERKGKITVQMKQVRLLYFITDEE